MEMKCHEQLIMIHLHELDNKTKKKSLKSDNNIVFRMM